MVMVLKPRIPKLIKIAEYDCNNFNVPISLFDNRLGDNKPVAINPMMVPVYNITED